MMFLQPGDRGLGIFLRTVHLGQHDAELDAARVIHLRANNVVIHIKTTGSLRKQRGIYGMTGKLHAQHRHAIGKSLRFKAGLIIIRDIKVQR